MSVSVKSVRIDKYYIWVMLNDARAMGIPLTKFPKLINASQTQLNDFELSPNGIHWNFLNQDLTIRDLLAPHYGITQMKILHGFIS